MSDKKLKICRVERSAPSLDWHEAKKRRRAGRVEFVLL
jgi:hypothetical protein